MPSRQFASTTHRAGGKYVGFLFWALSAVLPGAGLSGEDRTTTSQPASRGSVHYVSKLGDNSNGTTWAKAFTTIGCIT